MARPETDEEAALLGRIAVQHKLLTPRQLDEAMVRREQSDKKLGVVMLEMGLIDEFKLGKLLALQQRHLKQLHAQRRSQPPAQGRRAPRDAAATDEAIEVDFGRGHGSRSPEPRRAPPGERTARRPGSERPSASSERPFGSERPPPSSERQPRPSGRRAPSTGRPPTSDRSPQPPRSAPAGPSAPPPVAEPLLEPRNLEAKRSRQVEQLEQMLSHAAKMGASDIHLSPGNPVKMRRFGRLTAMTEQPLAPAATEAVLRAILNPWQQRRLDDAGEVDLAYAVPGVGRFRSNVYQQIAGLTGVFHYVPEAIPSLQELGLPPALAKLTHYSQGLILLTGPAGCGKTTTLASLVDIINGDRQDHILTIEDPIEYIHRSKQCVVNQRQVGRDTTSFARALRGALREDPDIICIGELRDLETISLALSAAETGHLVLGTLHTGSSIGTITRVVGAFPPSQQSQIRAMMSESLRAIISQRLVPTADGRGQAVALEILYVNNAVGALIRDNRTFQLGSILQTGKSQGMMQLDESLKELVQSGRVRREDALIHCEDPRVLGAEGRG